MKKSIIYTQTGDDGSTSLVGGRRVPKTHRRLEAYGTIDELNAHIGVLMTLISETEDLCYLNRLQNLLFVVGTELASEEPLPNLPKISDKDVEKIEKIIDTIDADLPKLKAFILPGGSMASAQCHVCRTVCRRAERRILSLGAEAPISSGVKRFMNRLSDYFFVLARKCNYISGKPDFFWDNSCI